LSSYFYEEFKFSDEMRKLKMTSQEASKSVFEIRMDLYKFSRGLEGRIEKFLKIAPGYYRVSALRRNNRKIS